MSTCGMQRGVAPWAHEEKLRKCLEFGGNLSFRAEGEGGRVVKFVDVRILPWRVNW